MNHTTKLPTRRPLAALLALALASATGAVSAQALTAAFTYQGELRLSSGPATAAFDMQFRLYNAQAGGAQIGATITATSVAVSGGLFSVPLDFGAAQFAGDRQWLEIAIRPAGSGSYETLSPRTEVTAAPYAWSARVALADSVTTTSIVDGTVGTADINATQVQWRVSGSCAAGQYVRVVNQDGTVTCGADADAGGTVSSIATGAGLTGGPITATGTISVAPGGIGTAEINATQVQRRVGGTCAVGSYVRQVNEDGTVVCGTDAVGAPAWGLSGNAGTNPATDFIGTTDAQPLELRAANARSLRIEPSSITSGSPALPITTNMVGGSHANGVTTSVRGATIAGGGVLSGTDLFFPNMGPNRVSDSYGTIGGGQANQAGNDNSSPTDSAFATVGGGAGNTATAAASTVAGGENNVASAFRSTVGGGVLNTASGGQSTVGGGRGNVSSGADSTVGGGRNNVSSSLNSTVGGGRANVSSASDSTVGGGAENTASRFGSTVVGGIQNTASGVLSTVGGGEANCAGGNLSWAGGFRARVRPGALSPAAGIGCDGVPLSGDFGDQGTFVWSDSSAGDFVSTGRNQFLVRAQGGMAINTNTPAAGSSLTVAGASTLNGNLTIQAPATAVTLSPPVSLFFGASTRQMVNLWSTLYGLGVQSNTFYARTADSFAWYQNGSHNDAQFDAGGGSLLMTLTPGASTTTPTGTARAQSFVNVSDRAAKTGFAAIDVGQVLSSVLAMPMASWAYRNRPEVRHLGPVAQDFHHAFGLGEDDRSISTIDANGVALAAIQGLNAKVEAERDALKAENAALRDAQSRLDAENAALRARLDRIEALVGAPAAQPRP